VRKERGLKVFDNRALRGILALCGRRQQEGGDSCMMRIYVICNSMMEAASTSETSANFYQTTRRYNPEDSHLHTRRCENIKSHLNNFFSFYEITKDYDMGGGA
jgi:hypothetical protein